MTDCTRTHTDCLLAGDELVTIRMGGRNLTYRYSGADPIAPGALVEITGGVYAGQEAYVSEVGAAYTGYLYDVVLLEGAPEPADEIARLEQERNRARREATHAKRIANHARERVNRREAQVRAARNRERELTRRIEELRNARVEVTLTVSREAAERYARLVEAGVAFKHADEVRIDGGVVKPR